MLTLPANTKYLLSAEFFAKCERYKNDWDTLPALGAHSLMGKICNHIGSKYWVKKYAKMSLERVIKVKKGEIISGRGTSICKCLVAQEIWQEMKLSQRQG